MTARLLPPEEWPPVPDDVTKVCDNTSVGVIVTDDIGRYLMFKRATPPVGIAPVAGHVDDHGTYDDAARAEVREEVGLTVVSLQLRAVRWRANVCRRRHGPIGPGHNWNVYTAVVAGDLAPDEREALDARWYTSGMVRALVNRTVDYADGRLTAEQFAADPGIEPVWVEFLHDAGVIHVSPDELAVAGRLAARSPYI